MIKFKLNTLLQIKKKTRYWLCKETGLDFNTINNMVLNNTQAIHLKTMDKLCQALDCKPGDLFTYEKDE